MTIWDFISRTADSLKQNAPDLTAAKNLFSSVSGNGGRRCRQDYFNHYVQEEEALSNMVLFGTIVAKNATQESLKAIPGASVAYKIVTKSVQDFNNSDKLQVDAKASNMITLEKKPLKQQVTRASTKKYARCTFEGFKHSSQSSSCETESEDVIRVFMMKEFLRKQFFSPCLKLLWLLLPLFNFCSLYALASILLGDLAFYILYLGCGILGMICADVLVRKLCLALCRFREK